MSDKNWSWKGTPRKLAIPLLLGCFASGNAMAVIDGTGSRVIDGTGLHVIDGTGARVIDGTGALVIDGTGVNVIDGTGSRVIDGTGARVIDGTGVHVIDGTGVSVIDGTGVYVIDGTGANVIDGTGANVIDGTGMYVIDGTGVYVIDGTGVYVIDGTGANVIDGTGSRVIDGTGSLHVEFGQLLARGQIDFVGDGFLSVMGQTIFDSGTGFTGLTVGATVAIYGVMDGATGGFLDTQIVEMAPAGVDAGVPDFLRGTVDSVDPALGIAVIGGLSVDYSALLSNGSAPSVGDELAITGRNYRDLGLLVATP